MSKNYTEYGWTTIGLNDTVKMTNIDPPPPPMESDTYYIQAGSGGMIWNGANAVPTGPTPIPPTGPTIGPTIIPSIPTPNSHANLAGQMLRVNPLPEIEYALNELRYCNRYARMSTIPKKTLQQKWVVGGKEEWRDIPEVDIIE